MNAFMQKLGVLAAMLSTFLSVFAFDFEADGIYYNITDSDAEEVEVTSGSSYGGYSGDIVVPSSVSYDGVLYTVAYIGDNAFESCSSLTSITIPNSVTYIGIRAFSDCSSLTAITIPNSVTYIWYGAFSGCSSLTSIDVDIDNRAYSSNDRILYDKLQTTLICCPGGKAEEVIIPNSVTSIEIGAFYDCSSLTAITIPNSVTSIGDYAFYDCNSLTSISIPNSVTAIGDGAFYFCRSLISITIPNSVTSIGYVAFYGCSSLTSITLPNSVTSIGGSAFSGCRSLSSITIPNSVTSIGEEVFSDCSSLTSIDVDVDNEAYSSNNGILYDKLQTTLLRCPEGKAEEVIIPNSVTSIGDYAFSGCSSLSSITIPNSVTSIRDRAFSDCSSLTAITIPNSVTSIGYMAFSGCSSLTSIDVDVDNEAYSSSNGILYDKLQTALLRCPEGKAEEVIIPNSVTSIVRRAFSGCRSLTSITSLAVTPPECGYEAIDGIDKQKCTLYVPVESVEAYKQAPGWKDFVFVEAVAGEAAGIDSVAAGTADGATEVFNLTGAKVADSLENLPAGIYLVREGSTVRKIAVK